MPISDDIRSLSPPAVGGSSELQAVRAQVDRILASDTFRSAEVLRRLLRFLANKTFSGEADDLKEYSIGLDALGKPPSYDPGKDAIVRLQASRLRKKLDEYYQGEGREDSFVVELPKGRFKIAWHERTEESFPDIVVPLLTPGVNPSEEAAPGRDTEVRKEDARRWRNFGIAMAALSLLLMCVTSWSLTRPARTVSVSRMTGGTSPELAELWSPFLLSRHHLVIAFSNPFFVRLQEGGYRDIIYHTMGVNSWEDAKVSSELPLLIRALGNATATPTFNMVERSTLVSTFVLSRFLASRLADISLARSSDVSWQQLADNDVILLASLQLDRKNSSLPVQPAFAVDTVGVRNLQPRPGEPEVYEDPQDHQESDGEGLELISMLPGPLGRTNVITFSSNHAWGIICAVQALTDPSFARVLTGKLKAASGKLPAYYQVVLKITYRDGTPMTASYVNHHVLTLK